MSLAIQQNRKPGCLSEEQPPRGYSPPLRHGGYMFANLIDFEITERFDWCGRLVRRSHASCPKFRERAGCAQIWQKIGPDQPEPSRRAVPYLVIALLNFLLVGWPLAANAQVANPGSWTRTQQSTVSVTELQVTAKADRAFRRGFEHLAKGDAAGSLEHFKRAIQEFPGFTKRTITRE